MNIFKLIILASSSIFIFTGCIAENPAPVEEKPKEIIEEPVVIQEKKEETVEEIVELTPLQKCEKEDGKFNLIVNAPEGSRIRILNIKPKYADCIALKEGRYVIEVMKKGYIRSKEWIILDEDTDMYVSLIELLEDYTPKVTDNSAFKSASYDVKKLKRFIKKYPKSSKINEAKNRIKLIESELYSYTPINNIKYSGCSGFYPKNLANKMLTKQVKFSKWSSIRWAGSCKNKLFYGRGTLSLNIKNKLHVELKGKMVNGFFEGNVYNNSSSKKNPSLIKGTGQGKFNSKLNTKKAFQRYQQ